MVNDNMNLRNAAKTKNDDFYTQYADIEKEMSYYKDYFKDKIVYCNTDNKDSNFVKYLQHLIVSMVKERGLFIMELHIHSS